MSLETKPERCVDADCQNRQEHKRILFHEQRGVLTPGDSSSQGEYRSRGLPVGFQNTREDHFFDFPNERHRHGQRHENQKNDQP